MKLPARYAKFLTALAGQVIVYLQWKYGASGAGVWAVPNAPAPPVTPTAT